jgi:hypothetical protein
MSIFPGLFGGHFERFTRGFKRLVGNRFSFGIYAHVSFSMIIGRAPASTVITHIVSPPFYNKFLRREVLPLRADLPDLGPRLCQNAPTNLEQF